MGCYGFVFSFYRFAGFFFYIAIVLLVGSVSALLLFLFSWLGPGEKEFRPSFPVLFFIKLFII
jgi:hypothetical protein